MRKMRDVPESDRPREKIAQKGAPALSESEILEVIIGRGTKDHDVRTIAREIADLMQKSPAISFDQLLMIKGVGPSKASQILACFELGRRLFDKTANVHRIVTAEDIVSLPEVHEIRDRRQEHFLTVTLNGAGEVLNARTITVGILNHNLVHPREVFADAITDRAASIICVHNHPCGIPEPSSQDITITTQLREAGSMLGIQLMDHIIVTKTSHTSMHDRGLL